MLTVVGLSVLVEPSALVVAAAGPLLYHMVILCLASVLAVDHGHVLVHAVILFLFLFFFFLHCPCSACCTVVASF